MPRMSELEKELLTGFLDGQLSSEEIRTVEELLANSREAQLHLGAIRQLRSDLSQLPDQKLGPDFASRVIAKARIEASQAKLPSEHHVLAGMCDLPGSGAGGLVELSNAQDIWTGVVRWIGGAMALAATLLFAVYLGYRPTQVPNHSPTADGNPNARRTGLADFPKGVLPEVDPPAEALPPIGPSGNDTTFVDDRKNQPVFSLLFVVDVTLSKNAWHDGAFRSVLDKAGVAMLNPVVADEKLQKSVEDSLVIANAPQPRPDGDQTPKVALLLVHADGKSLDRAMLELYSRPMDFPVITYNMAHAQSDSELFALLNREARQAADSPSVALWARPIVVRDERVVDIADAAQFSGTTLVSSDRSRKGWIKVSPDAGDVNMNPQTELLFVIRQPGDGQ